MRRLSILLLAASQVGLACNSTGKKPPAPTNAPEANNGSPFWSDDRRPIATGGKGETAHDHDGMLAGRLIDSAGRPQPNALVNVTAADAGPNAKPIGIQSDEQGYFIIKGLNSGATYALSVRSDDHGRVLSGTTTTQAPNTRLTIRLNEGSAAATTPQPPVSPASAPDGKEGKPKLADPPTSNIPGPEPAPITKDPLTNGFDQSWGPGKTPPVSKPSAPPPPASNPNIADSTSNPPPPPANISGPVGSAPKIEPPPLPASPSMSAVPSNSSPLANAPTLAQGPRTNFTLSDAAGTPVEFRNLSDRRLVVLDFWSTTCMPCLRKIPDLIDLQNRYASYVEVAGIACDDLPFAQRVRAVDGIKNYYLRKAQKPINYGVWFEGEGHEGRVQAQFKIKAYPTMILLDHTGRELWRGSDVRQLEESIKYCLMRR